MPLNDALILVVEDELFIALDLAQAVEDAGGIVLGPAATVQEALEIIERTPVDGAILDVNLLDRDVTPVATSLIEAGTPVVIQTGVGLPDGLSSIYPGMRAATKPCDPVKLVAQLAKLIASRA